MRNSYQNTQNYPNQMITFTVGTGTSKMKFKVHRQPACQQSHFINNELGDDEKWAALSNPGWMLPHVDPETFRLFVQYIYSRKITLRFHNINPRDDTEPTDSPNHSQVCGDQDETLVKLWVLARDFQIADLQNHVVENIMKCLVGCGMMRPSCYKYVYDNTKPGSVLRKLVVDLCCWYPNEETYYDNGKGGDSKFPYEMLVDIAKTFHKATADNHNRRLKEDEEGDEPKGEPIRKWYKVGLAFSNYHIW
jgi:hypothetical protein